MACIRGIVDVCEAVFKSSPKISELSEAIPPALFQLGVARILQEGLGRLDNVRHEVGLQFWRLLGLPAIVGADEWQIHGIELMRSLFGR